MHAHLQYVFPTLTSTCSLLLTACTVSMRPSLNIQSPFLIFPCVMICTAHIRYPVIMVQHDLLEWLRACSLILRSLSRAPINHCLVVWLTEARINAAHRQRLTLKHMARGFELKDHRRTSCHTVWKTQACRVELLNKNRWIQSTVDEGKTKKERGWVRGSDRKEQILDQSKF